MGETKDSSSERTPLRHLRACLVVLAYYLWLIVLLSAGAACVHLLATPFEAFRVDALYHVLTMHACGAVVATLAVYGLRGLDRAPPWGGKVALALLPVVLVLSCDRLALLTYAPTPLDPSAALFQGHPTRSWTLRPNAEAPTLDVGLNERGMRGPLIPFEKAEGEQRVMVLGDSVAFGGGVPTEQCFDRVAVELLERKGVNGVTFVNLSVPGYSPWQHIDVLRTEGPAYNPDVVLYAFCMNDVVDWLWRDVPGHDPSSHRFDALEISGFFRLGRGLWQDLRQWRVERSGRRGRLALVPALEDSDTPEVREAWRILLEQVEELVALARAQGRRMAFLAFPTSGQIRCDVGEIKNPQRRLVAYADANGIPCLELLGSFLAHCDRPETDPRELFLDGWHLSSDGHAATAAALVAFLVEEGLLDR
jgi:hypothetical protein